MSSGQIKVNQIVGQSFLFPASIQSGRPFSYDRIPYFKMSDFDRY